MDKRNVDLLIENGVIITINPQGKVIDGGSIAISGDEIVGIGSRDEIAGRFMAAKILDASGMAGLPGLIDTHHHANPGAMMPGVLDRMDSNVYAWIEKIHQSPLTTEYAYIAALVSCLASIRSGVTCVADFAMNPVDEVRAVIDAGIRGLKSVFFADQSHDGQPVITQEERLKLLDDSVALFQQKDGSADGKVKIGLGPDTEVVVSKAFFEEIVKAADQHQIPIHVHLSETMGEVKEIKNRYGKRSIEYAYDLGVLRPGTVVGHGCWLSPRDITLLAKSGASVSHAPISEMLCGAGFTPIPELLEAGVNVTMGRDVQSDMFQEIRTALFMPRINPLLDHHLVSIEQVFEMATINGAKALGWDYEIGSLEIGKKADIIMVKTSSPHMSPVVRYPELNILPLISSRAVASDVDTVVVNGKLLMENGVVLVVDEQEIMAEHKHAIESILKQSIPAN